jgi:molybdenum cofactor guanylyltransferase
MRERKAPPPFVGAILAGGASRRFGRDKVFAEVGGLRLVDRAVAALAEATAVVVVLGSRERLEAERHRLPSGVDALADDPAGYGPLGGLATVLARYPEAWVAVTAVDLPFVPSSWWRMLAEHHRPACRALVPRDASGGWEPLAALYHGSLGAPLLAAIERGEHEGRAVRQWLDDLHARDLLVAVSVDELPPGALVNVNTVEEAERAGTSLHVSAPDSKAEETPPRRAPAHRRR